MATNLGAKCNKYIRIRFQAKRNFLLQLRIHIQTHHNILDMEEPTP